MIATEGSVITSTGAALALVVEAQAPAQQTSGPLTTSQIMANALVDRGILTRSQVDAELARESSGEPAVEPSAQLDHIADDEESNDPVLDSVASSAFRPPATPGSYRFPVTPVGIKHDFAKETELRGIFHDAGVDQGLASDLVGRWNALRTAPKTVNQLAAVEVQTRASLARLWGPKYVENMATAAAYVDDIAAKHPQIKNYLNDTGLACDEWVVRQIFTRATARKGKS